MLYAIDANSNRVGVEKSGQHAICPDCGSEVGSRFGKFRIPHWYHKKREDCDQWAEPISEWHLSWQSAFSVEKREVRLLDEDTNEIHRADIKLNNGMVIEIQHSAIKPEEIEQREAFYGKNNMIWVLDGSSLAQRSTLEYKFSRQKFSLHFTIPPHSEEVPNYDMDTFKNHIIDSSVFSELSKDKYLKHRAIYNGNFFYFEYSKERDFHKWKLYILDVLWKKIIELYGMDKSECLIREMEVKYYIQAKDSFEYVDLTKKYWRSFIDVMKYPVFFDRLPGLEPHLMYWYQKNQLTYKSTFINKYANL